MPESTNEANGSADFKREMPEPPFVRNILSDMDWLWRRVMNKHGTEFHIR